MKEFFKKVLACFCAIAMCLSSTTLAFAQDTETMQVNDSETSSVRSFEVLEMQANVTATSHSVTVTPSMIKNFTTTALGEQTAVFEYEGTKIDYTYTVKDVISNITDFPTLFSSKLITQSFFIISDFKFETNSSNPISSVL